MDQEIKQQFDELLTAVKDGFDGVSEEFKEVKGDINVMKGDIKSLKSDVKDLKDDMKIVKSTMVTKDFVSEKNADLGAEIGKRINSSRQEQFLVIKKLLEFLKVDNGVIKKEHVEELEQMIA